MPLIANRRSIMNLLSDPEDIYSHRVRYVLAEKAISVEIIDISSSDKPEELLEYNPYNTLPTLVDRDLCLFDVSVICEYLDERFPHPPLMPVYPVLRAETRSLLLRIERDLYRFYRIINDPASTEVQISQAKLVLGESIISMAPVFKEKTYFLNDEVSLLDCSLAPLFWRLPTLEIVLSGRAVKPILDYCDRVFARAAFQQSLSEIEREYRD